MARKTAGLDECLLIALCFIVSPLQLAAAKDGTMKLNMVGSNIELCAYSLLVDVGRITAYKTWGGVMQAARHTMTRSHSGGAIGYLVCPDSSRVPIIAHVVKCSNLTPNYLW